MGAALKRSMFVLSLAVMSCLHAHAAHVLGKAAVSDRQDGWKLLEVQMR